jgi:hypothetical protein
MMCWDIFNIHITVKWGNILLSNVICYKDTWHIVWCTEDRQCTAWSVLIRWWYPTHAVTCSGWCHSDTNMFWQPEVCLHEGGKCDTYCTCECWSSWITDTSGDARIVAVEWEQWSSHTSCTSSTSWQSVASMPSHWSAHVLQDSYPLWMQFCE